MDPRLRVLFLLGVAVGIFFCREPWQVGAACGALAALWLVVGLGARRLLRQVVKLWGFALFVVVSYAFFANDPDSDRWQPLPLIGVPINVGGIADGAVMLLRVLAVILASQVARAGDAQAIARGLDKLFVPRSIALAIDTVLSLLGEAGGGRGGGMGTGGGRGAAGDSGESFWAAVKRVARGDVEPIVRRLLRHIERADAHAAGASPAGGLKDVAVVAGVSLTMLGIKALKVLPNIPFAPGHKLVVLTPLYIVAAMLTKGRFGATLTGITMGTVAFLLGDGKYGMLEIVKHVVPGVMTDLMLPLLLAGGRRPGGIVWSIVGGIIAAGRFATIFAMTLIVQAPAVAWAILAPGLAVHVTFGVLSGYVTFHIVKAIDRVQAEPPPPPEEEPRRGDGSGGGRGGGGGGGGRGRGDGSGGGRRDGARRMEHNDDSGTGHRA